MDMERLMTGTPQEQLALCRELTEKRLLLLINESAVPESLEYVLDEIAMSRFNRIGSEGINTQEQEGFRNIFIEDDFDRFQRDIEIYINRRDDSDVGGVRFL